MKKLMTSTIILLPLLLLAIMLVSGAIMSLVTHIYVESVEFVENDTLVLVMDNEGLPPAEQLEVNILPLKAVNRGLSFSVEDESIASVNENGVITAKYFGETYVTVASKENAAATAKRKVLVTDTSVHKLVLNEGYKAELYEGETQELSVTVYPKEAENKSVMWISSDESILHVSANGTVTSRGAGTATVTAVSNDNGEAKDTATFTCHRQLTDIGFDQTPIVSSSREQKFPAVTRIPADAEADLAYISSDPAIATVDEEGNITFLKEGKVAITVTATDFGEHTVSKTKEYTSTDGYYLPPLFEKKEYTVDFDEYFKDGKAIKTLPIPFATALEGSYQEFKAVTYSVADILTFDEETKKFSFAGEMPVGQKTIRVDVSARVYKTGEGIADYEDYFTLTVLRNAQSVSLSYMGTSDVAAITMDSKSVSLRNGISVVPANHTNDISYRLKEASDIAQFSGSTLTFSRAGEVTAVIELIAKEKQADGSERDVVKVSKEVRIAYAPVTSGSGTKATKFENGEKEQTLLLKAASEGSEEGILYFNEPADADVVYSVEEGADAAVRLEVRGGIRYVVPQKGGFATVIITVTPKAQSSSAARRARRAATAAETYSVRVYVDRPVLAENFKVKFDGSDCTKSFGTALSSLPYTVTVDRSDGAMEGKKLYVSYGTQRDAAAEGALTQSGNVLFGGKLSTLTVTFGVEYGEEATALGAKGGLASTARTITRNATSIAVSYNGNGPDVAKISTWQHALIFTAKAAEGDVNERNVNLMLLPANHTNTIVYSIAEGEEYASITSAGTLTFKDRNAACSVKVKISLLAQDGTPVAAPSREIVVAYAPASEKDVVLSDNQTHATLLLSMGNGKNDMGFIRFTEPTDTKVPVDYKAEGSAVEVRSENGTYRIVPVEGGFADVKVTVTPQEGAAKLYTVRVYVDRPVVASDLAILLDGKAPFLTAGNGYTYGTAGTQVGYLFTVDEKEGSMKGKKLYVTYDGATDENSDGDAVQQSGEIPFAATKGTLQVTFGVEYGTEAKELLGQAAKQLVTRTVTLKRNATGITFSHKGTEADTISTSTAELTFTPKASESSQVGVKVIPENHQNTISYALKEGDKAATITPAGVLTFQNEGKVTVVVSLCDDSGAAVFSKEIEVSYAPLSKQDKPVDIVTGTKEYYLLLNFAADGTDEGVINFTAPADAAVDYKASNDVVTLIEKGNGRHIVPQKSGFADVTITVKPNNGGAETQYTIHVYADRPVTATDLEVTFTEGVDASFGTILESVPYTFTFKGQDGAMEGKKLHVEYGSSTPKEGTVGIIETSGEIAFPMTDSTLIVTFSVRYDEEKTANFQPESGLSSVSRTLRRNAADVTFTYNNVQTVNIMTGKQSFIIGSDLAVAIVPAAHTDTISYRVEGTAAQLSDAATLTFGEPGTVKLVAEMKRGETTTLTRELTISYASTGADKGIEIATGTADYNLLLNGTSQEGLLYYTLPAAHTDEITCKVTSSDGVVTVAQEKGIWHIKPQEGGFATVEFTADTTYTIHVYVDKAVSADEVTFAFGDNVKTYEDGGTLYATTATQVAFTVSVSGTDAMQGKRIYVQVGEGEKVYGTDNEARHTFTIDFVKTSGTLAITYGVEYADAASAYHPVGDLITKSAGIERNAEAIKVAFGGAAETQNLVTSENTINFSTVKEVDAKTAKVTVEPSAHTEKGLEYALENTVEGATMSKEGSLVFEKNTIPLTVTVVISVKRGADVTLSGKVTVTYMPVAEGADEQNQKVELGTQTKEDGTQETNFEIVLTESAESSSPEEIPDTPLYVNVPTGSKVTQAEVTKGGEEGSEVVMLVPVLGADEQPIPGAFTIQAKKGGFATITITVSDGAPMSVTRRVRRAVMPIAGVTTYTIEVYVDRPVKSEDFAISFNANKKALTPTADGENVFRTSYDEVTFKVTVADNNGSMEGKRLYVKLDENDVAFMTADKGVLELTGTLKDQLAGEGAHTIIFGVEYDEDALKLLGKDSDGLSSVEYSIQSTHGKLYSKPTVKYLNVNTLNKDQATELVFDDLTSTFTLIIDKTSYDPIDFTFDSSTFNSNVVINGDGNVYIRTYASWTPAVIIGAKNVGEDNLTFEFYGQSYQLNVKVHAKAKTISVEGGGTESDLKVLDADTKYKTLLNTLTFRTTIGRDDGQYISNKNIQWSYDNEKWNIVESESDIAVFTVNIKDSPSNSLFFRSGDGGASIQIMIERVTIDDVKFNFSVFVNGYDGEKNAFATIDSDKIGTDDPISYIVPGDMQGTITFQINYLEEKKFLGGFGNQQEFTENTVGSVQEPGDGSWKVSYESNLAQIIFSSQNTSDFTMKCKVSYYDRGVTVLFTHYNLSIEFPGFDGENTSDVYKGYQQVRVFAKHSYYNSTDGLVDYFKLPLKAINNTGTEKNIPVEGLVWNFVGYRGNTPTEFKLTQSGLQVTYDGVTYTIVKNDGKPSTLQTADGTVIAKDGKYADGQKHVPWVDVYAETNVAYLYFGEFGGLSETDVQNDYFGNFGNKETWTQPNANPNDNSGRDFAITDSSFTFLHVDAGFGESYQGQNKRACYFNFNILADETLVNVFDAAGYCANDTLVLHENLYGPNETPNAPEAQVLQSQNVNELNKTTIYGNGYQVNFEARNADLVSHQDAGTSQGVHLEKVYNVTVKASNPKEKVVKKSHVVVLTMKYVYYCDIEYYSKMSPWGAGPSASGRVYLKNTILRCAAQSALQLYYQQSTAYIENVVLNECVGGFVADSKDGTYNVVFNFKGFVDVLNYLSYTGLGDSLGLGADMMDVFGFGGLLKQCDKYLEWFGKKPDELINNNDGRQQDWWSSRFANVFLYNRSVPSHSSTITLQFWDDNTNSYLPSENGKFGNGSKVLTPIDAELMSLRYKIVVYDAAANLDGGLMTGGSQEYNDRDMSQLFSESRHIRLLCQYKTLEGKGKNATPVKNFDHILWHMQQIYRDYSLIGLRESHIANLKKSLGGVTWPDGSGVSKDGEVTLPPEAAALTSMIAETVLPSKHLFAD